MSKKTFALLGCLLVAACGPSKLDVAQANYQQCLAANSATPYNCDGLGRIYEIERRDQKEWERHVDRDHDEFMGTPKPAPQVPGYPNTPYQPR